MYRGLEATSVIEKKSLNIVANFMEFNYMDSCEIF